MHTKKNYYYIKFLYVYSRLCSSLYADLYLSLCDCCGSGMKVCVKAVCILCICSCLSQPWDCSHKHKSQKRSRKGIYV